MNLETDFDSMQSTQISVSDHLLLHVFVKPSNLYQRGPSYWNLNEEILKNGASLICEDLKNFIEKELPSSYENLKHNFHDLLKFIEENKKRVDQKELNNLKYGSGLRDCIHSGKGPSPSLIEKCSFGAGTSSKSLKGDFFLEKFRKLSTILLSVFLNFVVKKSQVFLSFVVKKTINSIKRIQVDQNAYHTDDDILNQFRKYFSHMFLNNFTKESDQLIITFLSKKKTRK